MVACGGERMHADTNGMNGFSSSLSRVAHSMEMSPDTLVLPGRVAFVSEVRAHAFALLWVTYLFIPRSGGTLLHGEHACMLTV